MEIWEYEYNNALYSVNQCNFVYQAKQCNEALIGAQIVEQMASRRSEFPILSRVQAWRRALSAGNMPLARLRQRLSRLSRVAVRHRRSACVAATCVSRGVLVSHEETNNDEYKKRHKVRSSCVRTMEIPSTRKLYNNPFTICIEGNIGSGKTTFLNHFQNFNATILQEPVDLWRDVAGINLLDLFYKDPVNYAFLFQSYVQLTRLKLHTIATPSPYKVMERSVFSARCFLENMKRTHMIQDVEAMVLENWYDWCMENTNIRTDLIIYLRTTPEVVFQRMHTRARKEEDSVSLEYLRQIHEIHDDWLYRQTLFSLPAPVMIIDGDKSLEEMVPQFEKCKDRILNEQTDGTANTRIVLNTKA